MKYLRGWLVSLIAVAVSLSPVTAEDAMGRWSFSLGGGILSTLDDIRNNAAVIDEIGERGIPDDLSDDIILSFDRRQDDLLGRETEIEETGFINLGVSYGLTSWLSLMIDVSYYDGNVSNLDSFQQTEFFVDGDNNDIIRLSDVSDRKDFTPRRDASVPLSVGDLKQIPLMFSALFRFRKDSPFNPFLGAGVGWMFTDLEESQAFRDLNDEILRGFQRTTILGDTAVNIQGITDLQTGETYSTSCAGPANDIGQPERACHFGQEQLDADLAALEAAGQLTPELEAVIRAQREPLINADFIPTKPFITTELDDGFAFQILAGADYHFNDRWSAYVLGRYLVTDAKLKVRISDNGNLVTRTTGDGKEEAIHFETDDA
ncbi:MAG: hypothetical protein O7F16_10415, partial [Acidobacteria bacterium]|nr:hypothetical protein [Acidobacteriota bacterium]